jgi:hypothetical protein
MADESSENNRDGDLTLVEEMSTRALQKQRLEMQDLFEQRRAEMQDALRRMQKRLQGKKVDVPTESDLELLDELVAQAPGSRVEHIGAQRCLKDVREKARAEEEDAGSDTE